MRVLSLVLALLFLAAACADELTPIPAPAPIPAPSEVPARTPTPEPTRTPTPEPTAIFTPTPSPTLVPPTPTFTPGAVILPTVEALSPTPTPEPLTGEDLSRKLDAIGFRMSIVRDLSSRGPVERAFITKDELRAMVLEDMVEDREKVQLTQKLYTMLGILEPNTDLSDLIADVTIDIVLGAFDTEENRLYIVGDETNFGERDELTVAHEFVHGLQQLHFDVRATRESIAGNADQTLAYAALLEGDATVGQLLYQGKHFDELEQAAAQTAYEGDDFSAYRAAPRVIQRTIAFPYVEGRSYVVSLFLETNDFELIDEALEYVPRSTEQVIHPEKYASREEPVEVAVPDVSSSLGEGWAEVDRDTFGELFLRSYLETWMDPQEASVAAEGWGGDRFALYEGPDGALALGALTTWDTTEDAVEFFEALRDVTRSRLGSGEEPLEGVDSAFLLVGESQSALISLEGQDVAMVLAPKGLSLPVVLQHLRSVPEPTATPTPTPSPTPEPPTPTPTFSPGAVILPTAAVPFRTPTPEPSAEQVLSRKLDAIGLRASVVRELSARGPAERAFITKDELNAMVLEGMEEGEATQLTQKLYTMLGILEPNTDLPELIAVVSTDIAHGFFDTQEKKIYIVGDEADFTERDELAFAHQFIHGLQQLHFDVRTTRESIAGNTDRMLAYTALLEGDATVGELLYQGKHFDEQQNAAVQAEYSGDDLSAYLAAPMVIQRTVAFPYVQGRSYAISLFLETNDFELIDEALAYVPRSTEQVIHPEKYASREEPVEVAPPDVSSALGEGWAEVGRDTFGELILRSYLEMWIDPQEASVAAEGWGGDRVTLYEGPDGDLALVALTTWDTTEDAVEFFEALRDATRTRLGSDGEPLEDVESAVLLVGESQSALISLEGQDVTMLLGPSDLSLPGVLLGLRSGDDQG